jgi:GAF domain-containing protein
MNSNFENLISEVDKIIINEKGADVVLQKICDILKEKIFHYDWVGFYLLDQSANELILGPYSGKPTDHTHIPVGKGVCGQVAESKKTKVVQDVSKEDNYISCSIDVQSEIVVPVLKNNKFIAELDIDSNSPAPFTHEDEAFLKDICDRLSAII